MVEKRWLTVFIVTCALGLAVDWTSSKYTYIVSFLAFVRYQQNHDQKVFNWGTLRLFRGKWYSQIHWFIVFHISYWGAWSFVWGAKPTKDPRSDVTGYQQTSISKIVLPNHARWDIGLLDAQQWLQSLTFDCNCVEQLYSVQPLRSCTIVSINALFNKSLHHNRI